MIEQDGLIDCRANIDSLHTGAFIILKVSPWNFLEAPATIGLLLLRSAAGPQMGPPLAAT